MIANILKTNFYYLLLGRVNDPPSNANTVAPYYTPATAAYTVPQQGQQQQGWAPPAQQQTDWQQPTGWQQQSGWHKVTYCIVFYIF